METGIVPIPFSRRFVNFWMGWWILVYTIAIPLHAYFHVCIARAISELCFYLWLIQAARILYHNMRWREWTLLFILGPIILTMEARDILSHSSVEVTSAGIIRETFDNFALIAIIIMVVGRFVIPISAFIYTKWYLGKYGEYYGEGDCID